MSTSELTFSIVVNTTDRADSLHTLLRSLDHQSYPHFEVVVVVGPTRDHTLAMLEPYGDRIRVLRCPRANLSQSRNIGLLAAQGDIVAYIDDDAVPCRNWLLQLNRLFADSQLDATGGIVYLVHPNAPAVQHRVGIVSALAEQFDVRQGALDLLPPAGEGRLWTQRMMGTNMAYRRRRLLDLGGFDEFYEWVYDDTDLAIRLAAAGGSIHPVMEACVYHVPASSRNRTAYTYVGRWWIQTKAATYFALKNGSAAGVPWRASALRALHIAHGHWLWTGQLQREGKITFGQLLNMRWQEVKSSMHGFAAGAWSKRQLVESAAAVPDDRPIHPFPTGASAFQPAVDPVGGRQAVITMPDPPLRLALLSHSYPPEHQEGVGRHTNLMAQGLFALGHTVHVVTHGEQEIVTFYDGAYVHRLPYRLARYDHLRRWPKVHHMLNYSHAVYDKLQRMILNDDIQLADSPVWQADGFVTAVAGILPVVVRPQTAVRQIAHLEQRDDDDNRLIGEMEELLLQRAAYLAPNSRATVKALREVYGLTLAADQYTVVPHGIVPVAEEAVRPFPVAAPPARPTVLFVGRLEQRKGIQTLLEAIPQVLAKAPDACFVIAGADNSANDGFRLRTGLTYPAYFAQRYAAYAEAVSFLGHVDEEKLQALYQSCDLFVAPSLYESFGLIYLEAMNYAKPVIACHAGGIPEVVEDGVTGQLIEPGAGAQLAAAITTLLGSPQRLHDMGLAGRQRLLAHFTHVQMARGFEAIYRQVLHRAQTAAST